MLRGAILMLSMIAIASGVPVYAQPAAVDQGWHLSADFISVATRGNDVHVGDVFTAHSTIAEMPQQFREDYGVDFEPLLTRMKADRNGMVTARYRGARWGFGVRGWRVSTGGSVQGTRSSSPSTPTSDSVTGVRFWDHSVHPLRNMREPSGWSPVSFYADNSLENLRVDGYVERVWIDQDNLNVTARFGVARAHLENTRAERMTERAYIELDEPLFGFGYTLTNDTTLESQSKATMKVTGPVLGIAGDYGLGRVRFEWSIEHSAMLGTADTSGTWTDMDDAIEVGTFRGTRTELATLLSGSFPTSQEERVLVPVVDLQMKTSVRAVGAVTVGVGVFSSTWFDLPVAPAFSVPGEWIALDGTGWRQQTRNVTFIGISISAGLRF